ncbi:mycofactocin-coupled SDR family oxidoreductase [Sporichthya sp.]|uniref:mycofactocin-coupled SDR family oxidoreductase n=1 Tax=Sporichthya sp. TaxID=65475 RepID=UPI001810CE47|nr:mycofactocin-coupled SDR family oxidoreductase [Sporichthya sp.]MBA3743555.1 mycofactocin-coupled SDR family oxidoreductase [Sporichthya sp.]
MGRVAGKVALVTGAARGQGRSHALRLAAEGADIIAIDACTEIETVQYEMGTRDELDQTAKEVEALDRRISVHQADVRDLDQMIAAVNQGIADLGQVDIVVANAGIMSACPTHEMDQKTWQVTIDINLTGVFTTVRAAIPHMLERNAGGSIILISSTAGIKGFPTLAHYTAAKHGVVGLMKTWAYEWGGAGIRCNSIHPTAVDTRLFKNDAIYQLFRPDLENPGPDDMVEAFTEMHCLPQAWLQPSDISDAVLFLSSDESKCITGQQLKVDLGFCEK